MKEFKVLSQIGNTPSTNMKKALLKRYESPNLKKICFYTYNPFINFYVKQLDIPDRFNDVEVDVSLELFQVLDELASRRPTPTQGRAMLKRVMSKTTEEHAKWIARIVSRDLKIGISVSTINSVFKELIPEFKVSLANPMTEISKGIDHWEDVKYPAEGTEKIDGLRCVAICDGEVVRFFSRKGLEFETLDYLTPQILKLRLGTKFVLDAECCGIAYNENCEVAKKNYEAGTNWVFAQASSMVKTKSGAYTKEEMSKYVGLMVFDLIDYDYFMSQGKEGENKPLKTRKTELSGMFRRLEKPLPNIQLLPNRVLKNKEEAVDFFKEVIARKGEGIIIADLDAPYEFKRSNARIKLKGFFTCDLRVIGCEEGKAGTKKEGSLGAIVVSDDDKISGKLMGGWDDDEGFEMWLRFKKGEFVGTIVECGVMEITADNSLRHGVFIRERSDKTEISWG